MLTTKISEFVANTALIASSLSPSFFYTVSKEEKKKREKNKNKNKNKENKYYRNPQPKNTYI